MDSGVAVPTLRRGVSTTLAVKLLTSAGGLGAAGGAAATARSMGGSLAYLDARAAFRTLCTAGRSRAISRASTATTINNSNRVKARRPVVNMEGPSKGKK